MPERRAMAWAADTVYSEGLDVVTGVVETPSDQFLAWSGRDPAWRRGG